MPSHPWTLALLAGVALAAFAAQAQDVRDDQEQVRRAIHVCASCHGDNGRSKEPTVPSLAGQSSQYLIEQLRDFRSQTRIEGGTRAYMWGVSALLDDATIAGLAGYYAAQPPGPGVPGKAAEMAAGRRIFERGIPERGVRACASCHGDAAEGAAAFPRLAGQHSAYLLAQLRTFSTQLRPHGVLMKNEVRLMTSAEMRSVAVYLQSQ